jgi:hypothetical protein
VQDCPFDAITMVDRTDGKRFPSQAQVDPARCVGCGVCAGSCDSEGIGLTWFDTRIEEARMERAIETAAAAGGLTWVALVAAEIRGGLPRLDGYEIHRVPTASWVRPKFLERLFAGSVRGVLVVRDARAEAAARDGGRWVSARLTGERKPVLRPERVGSGRWCVVDFDPSRPRELARMASEFRSGAVRRVAPASWIALTSAAVLTVALTFAAVGPSHLRVVNPTPQTPELVLSFKAFGERGERLPGAQAAESAAELAKPVHMRGGVTTKSRRADVIVKLTIDGMTETRVFAAKGFSNDGPAIGEWRRPWAPGEHQVSIEILRGETVPALTWAGSIQAVERRLNVLTYEPSGGFVLE